MEEVLKFGEENKADKSVISALPNDVLADILSKLSVKNLCQIKSVSKKWLNLICTSDFKKLHYQNYKETPTLLFVEQQMDRYFAAHHAPVPRPLTIYTIDMSLSSVSSFPPKTAKKFSFDVLGRNFNFSSSHNMVCYNIVSTIWVYNQTTRERLQLPSPSIPTTCFDIGYVPTKNEFKIVTFPQWRLEILTIQDGGIITEPWKKVLENDDDDQIHNKIASMSMNGTIYWLVVCDKIGIKKRVFSIDLVKEEFNTKLCCPEAYNGEEMIEIKGELCLVEYENMYSGANIYVLKDDQKKQIWVKEYSINLSNMAHWFRVGGYVAIDDEILFFPSNGKALLYNLKNKSFRNVGDISVLRSGHKSIVYDGLFSLTSRYRF